MKTFNDQLIDNIEIFLSHKNTMDSKEFLEIKSLTKILFDQLKKLVMK